MFKSSLFFFLFPGPARRPVFWCQVSEGESGRCLENISWMNVVLLHIKLSWAPESLKSLIPRDSDSVSLRGAHEFAFPMNFQVVLMDNLEQHCFREQSVPYTLWHSGAWFAAHLDMPDGRRALLYLGRLFQFSEGPNETQKKGLSSQTS